MAEDMSASGGNRYHMNITQIATAGTSRDLIEYVRLNWPQTFCHVIQAAAHEHLSYATRTMNAHAARIAGDCGRRCEQIARAVENGAPLDLDDIRIRVEAFNLAAKTMGLSRTHRNAIVNREAVAHINGSSSDGH